MTLLAGRTVHRRRWTRDDRAASVWHGLEVEVPPSCPGLLVRLLVPDLPGVVVDLGCEGPSGWRGWSGGARRDFAITPAAATPGYLPGELEAGTWHVVIGLHRIPTDGVELEVVAETGQVAGIPGRHAYDAAAAGVGPVERPPRRDLPAPTGMRWVACDFHTHTLHSDGSEPVAAVAARAVSAGLDLVAITDHNTVAHHAELPTVGRRLGIGLLAGQEITTEAGHANAFGEIGAVDFRRQADTWVDAVAERGGLLSVNHPLAADFAWRHPLVRRPPLAEVWHWTWLDPTWSGPVAWWQAWDHATTPIGGSDWHGPGSSDSPPGSPTTWVLVDTAAAGPDELPGAVLDGLRNGRTAISAGHSAPVLLRAGDELLVIGGAGGLVVGPDGSRRPVPTEQASLPVTGTGPGGHLLIDHDGLMLSLSG